MRSSVPGGFVLAGWQPVGRWQAGPEFIIGGRHGLRFYAPRRPAVRRDAVLEAWAADRRPAEVVRGGELAMGRIYWDVDQGGRPDPLAQDQQAIREGVATAYAATAASQAEAAQFFVQNGAAVLPGHPPTGRPGREGDPDNPLPDASDL